MSHFLWIVCVAIEKSDGEIRQNDCFHYFVIVKVTGLVNERLQIHRQF